MKLLPETIARIRQEYADGVRIKDIQHENKISKEQLYYWIDGGPSDRPLTPIARRAKRREPPGDDVKDRRLLVARLWRTANRQVRDIEERLKTVGHRSPARERDVRALAILVKSLRELAAFDEAQTAATTRTNPEDDDYGPRDIDDFRRELARKMDALVARRAARDAGDPQSGTD